MKLWEEGWLLSLLYYYLGWINEILRVEIDPVASAMSVGTHQRTPLHWLGLLSSLRPLPSPHRLPSHNLRLRRRRQSRLRPPNAHPRFLTPFPLNQSSRYLHLHKLRHRDSSMHFHRLDNLYNPSHSSLSLHTYYALTNALHRFMFHLSIFWQ